MYIIYYITYENHIKAVFSLSLSLSGPVGRSISVMERDVTTNLHFTLHHS